MSTFIGRHKKNIIFGIVVGFFITLFIITLYPYFVKLQSQRIKKIGLVGKYDQSNLPSVITKQLSFGLTAINASGEATSSVAKSWDIDEKGLNFIFHLYPDLYWQDGTKFKAGDVKYHLKDVKLAPVDDNTLKITIKEPYAPLPVLLSKPIFKQDLVGLGLYKIQKITYSGDYITNLTLVSQNNELSPVEYKFYPNTDDAILGFKRGEVNELDSITQTGDLGNWKTLKITSNTQFDRYVAVFFNLDNGLFKEKEIRQALAYAIPDFKDYEKVYSPIPPDSWAYSQKIRLYHYDPDTAKKILNKNPIASKSSELTVSTFAQLLPTAQQIIDAWSKVGVNAKVKVENSIPTDFQILVLTQTVPPDPDQYPYWQSTQETTNISNYSNLKIDKLLEDGRKTYDQEKRKKIYADFQRYLVDDEPVIFLYYPKTYTVTRK